MMLGNYSFSPKAFNFRTVLETIRMQGPISRAGIARITDLTPQTISNITRRLLDHELIKETTKVQEGRGAPSTSLVINPRGAYSIGLDIDQDHLTGILMDFSGTVLHRISHSLSLPQPEEAIKLMVRTVEALRQQGSLEKQQIWGVGIGVPGPLEISKGSLATNIVHPKAFRGWDHVPIASLVNKGTALPVYLENNATAAAIGEQWFGDGRNYESFFYLFLSLGLGGGLILNKLPFRGFFGNAGEIGFMPKGFSTNNDEPVDKTHVGIHFNIPRLVDQLQEKYSIEHVTELTDLFENKEPILMDWLHEGAEVLVPLLLSVEYLIDPQAILVGGRMPKPIMNALVEQAKAMLPSMRIKEKTSFPELVTSEMTEDAVALGVATIPLYEVLTPLASLFTTHNSNVLAQPYTKSDHPIHQIF